MKRTAMYFSNYITPTHGCRKDQRTINNLTPKKDCNKACIGLPKGVDEQFSKA
jgi:hypothetical protein